jgi:phospholipase C
MLTSGTAAGHGSNDIGFATFALTQNSIFQVLTEHNISWENYEDTGGTSDANFYSVGASNIQVQ